MFRGRYLVLEEANQEINGAHFMTLVNTRAVHGDVGLCSEKYRNPKILSNVRVPSRKHYLCQIGIQYYHPIFFVLSHITSNIIILLLLLLLLYYKQYFHNKHYKFLITRKADGRLFEK
jgi:hypothetical protein